MEVNNPWTKPYFLGVVAHPLESHVFFVPESVFFFFLQGPDSLTQKPGSPWDVVSQSAWLFGRDMAGSICPSAEVTWAISSAWKWGKWKFHLQTMLKWLHPGRLTWNMSSWRPRRSFSFLNGWFVGSMLSFQGVFIHKINIYTPPWERKKPYSLSLPLTNLREIC